MGFDIAALHSESGDYLIDSLIILFEEFCKGLAPVGKELPALQRAAYYFSGEYGQPGDEVVASAGPEFLRKIGGPGFGAGLVTIDQQVRNPLLPQHPSCSLLVHLKIIPEVAFPGILVELVHLQASGIGRCRMVHLAGQRCPEAVDAPAPFRQRALQAAFGGHAVGQHDDVRQLMAIHFCHALGRISGEIIREAVACFLLEMLDFILREEFQALDISRHAEITCIGIHIDGGILQGGFRDIQYCLPVLAVLAFLEDDAAVGTAFPGAYRGGFAFYGERADGDGFWERYRHGFAGIDLHLGPEFLHTFIPFRQLDRYHGYVIAIGIHFNVFIFPGNIPVRAGNLL